MERPSKKALIRYFRGESSPNERELVQLYLAMNRDARYVENCLREAWSIIQSDTQVSINDVDLEKFKYCFNISKSISDTSSEKTIDQKHEDADTVHYNSQENISHYSKGIQFIKLRNFIKFAAALIFVVGSSILLLRTFNAHTIKEQLVREQPLQIEPGQDKALLTLADGQVIKLSDIAVGAVMKLQNGVRVEKKSDGNIVYHTDDGTNASKLVYNTVITPNGGQYRITLPDGSKAFLNAGSSLKYPLCFASKERRVKMTGEVYFEIAKLHFSSGSGKQGRVPFYVESDKQEIKVLGTHFNVNAYPNERHVVTSLIEGSVQVKASNGRSVILTPGEQALVAEDISVKKTDLSVSLAWTNGDFVFKGEPLQSVLRKVARWYDIEVECPPELAEVRFSGIISRSQPLSTIMDMLEMTKKVKVSLIGRRLTVRN